ncbi:hypothetical protein QBC47DRAFT_395580 [Echria macrotheca]|uniref:Uncharacterized protein n=1 Tax=Echria macrotheca TaxID=438768 RepID=A0AAJ0EZZ6_9PEZI|nr:hypothetical protein QBC47DRAFT_395580 [Echria macrotheca]
MAVSASHQLLPNDSFSVKRTDNVPPFQSPVSESLQTNADAFPARHDHHLSTPNFCSPSRSVFPVDARTSEPSSINCILRENNRVRLFVYPLQWTSKHLLLLGCKFLRKTVRGESRTRNTGGHTPDNACASDSITSSIDDIRHAYSSELKASLIGCLLQTHGIHSSSCDLSFRFGQRVVDTLPTDGLFSCSPSSSDPPTLAYLDLGTTAQRRNRRIVPRTKPNPPMARLQQIHTRRLRPKKETEDPYIAAVLIAMAQGWHHIEDHKKTPEYKVHLLALPATKARVAPSRLYFYKAIIPRTFLDRFDYPSQDSQCDSIVISYYCIPLKPEAEMRQAIGFVISNLYSAMNLGQIH